MRTSIARCQNRVDRASSAISMTPLINLRESERNLLRWLYIA
jgi:hypothetical protein